MQISVIFAEKQPIFSEEDFFSLFSNIPLQRQEKLSHLKNKPKRQMSLLASLLLTTVLCKTLAVSPKELQFSVNAHGKPFLPNIPNLQFSLSHSHACAAVVTDSHPIGIDVEKIRPYRSSIPARFFTVEEQAYLQKADTEDAFYEIWTQKEAYVKQSGTGFSVAPESFSVKDPDTAARLFSKTYNGYMFSLCTDSASLPRSDEAITWREYSVPELCRFFL